MKEGRQNKKHNSLEKNNRYDTKFRKMDRQKKKHSSQEKNNR